MFLSEWRRITSDSGVLQAIVGYRLPFIHYPSPQIIEPSPRLSNREEQICAQEVSRLLGIGAVERAASCIDQFLSPFFVIRKSSGGWRFILNLKRLNKYILAPHFKMENWKTVVRLISPGDFLASVDLEDAYLLVPIHQEHRKYLRFRFQDQIYQFTALPFGLASAPYIFTKILKPVLSTLRERGFLSVVYLDDFLLIAPSRQDCQKNITATINLLQSLGFLINKNKSVLVPSKSCRFLGLILDSGEFAISIPTEKRRILLERTTAMLSLRKYTIRFLASYIGSLIAVCPAVQYGLLHTKPLEREKYLALGAAEENFEAIMKLPDPIRRDLLWWKSIFADTSQRNYIRSGLFTLEIFTDASLTGWGTVCDDIRTHGFWSLKDKKNHINYLELLAVFHALRCFASNLKDCEILLRVDNSTALAYINRMGSIRFPHLSDLARRIWDWCADRNIFIYAAYIPSAQNFEADAESRIVSEETEWTIEDTYFRRIESHFGRFDIDLFASSINTKCPCFISWIPDPLAYAVDAFSLDWSNLRFYAFPPFILILRVLRKILTDRAEGVVVVLVACPTMVSSL